MVSEHYINFMYTQVYIQSELVYTMRGFVVAAAAQYHQGVLIMLN